LSPLNSPVAIVAVGLFLCLEEAVLHMSNPTDAERVRDLTIHRLVKQRLRDLGIDDGCGAERNVEIVVVEQGDTLDALERETGCCIARGYFSAARVGNPDYSPSFEVVEEHQRCYEIVFVFNDDGAGTLIFVPKHPGIDRELLSLCRIHAVKPRRRS
jgi:hypothetical protein